MNAKSDLEYKEVDFSLKKDEFLFNRGGACTDILGLENFPNGSLAFPFLIFRECDLSKGRLVTLCNFVFPFWLLIIFSFVGDATESADLFALLARLLSFLLIIGARLPNKYKLEVQNKKYQNPKRPTLF